MSYDWSMKSMLNRIECFILKKTLWRKSGGHAGNREIHIIGAIEKLTFCNLAKPS